MNESHTVDSIAVHSFEHASHVAMSVVKLLSRIVAPSEVDVADDSRGSTSLHDGSFGITSDPITQFTCIFAALIHDLDHPGVPNSQLVAESSPLAQKYGGKSVAEQNSVDLAFGILIEDRFAKLRRAIYRNEVEMRRFRELAVNTVMATDIVDKGTCCPSCPTEICLLISFHHCRPQSSSEREMGEGVFRNSFCSRQRRQPS